MTPPAQPAKTPSIRQEVRNASTVARRGPPISLTELAHQPITVRELALLIPALMISLVLNLGLVVALLIYNAAHAGADEDNTAAETAGLTGLADKGMIDFESKGNSDDPNAKTVESPIEVPGVVVEKPMIETPKTPEKKDTGSGGKKEEGFAGTTDKPGALPGTFMENTAPGLTGDKGFGPAGDGSGLGGKGGGTLNPGGFGDRTGNLLEKARRSGGNDASERAVLRGLQWLAQHQGPDGRWTLDRYHEHGRCKCRDFSVEDVNNIVQNDAAATAMALLPFLGAGQTHQKGSFAENIKSGLLFLMDKQESDGNLGGRHPQSRMYAHGLATIALCEAYALSHDPKIRVAAQRALNFIVAAQNPKLNGWFYTPRSTQDSDLSVGGWQIMALRSGQLAGLSVSSSVMEKARRSVEAHGYEKNTQYSYRRGTKSGSPAMTAAGLLCRQYLGWRRDNPSLKKGCDFLLANLPPQAPAEKGAEERIGSIYYYYYASQVMHHMGGEHWEKWNPRMRDFLIRTQEKEGHRTGSWNPEASDWGRAGGRIYVTSLAILTLEVYYRHLPLYRHGAEQTPQAAMKPKDKAAPAGE